jgi:hypothetical protein
MPPQIEKFEGLKQACNPHRRVAPTEHIFHKRAALTGVQPSQACSSHRRVALTGVQLSRGIALIGYISHERAALTGV